MTEQALVEVGAAVSVVESQIAALESTIEKVEAQVEGAELAGERWREELLRTKEAQLRSKEAQLRTEKEQLRNKEAQLRAEKALQSGASCDNVRGPGTVPSLLTRRARAGRPPRTASAHVRREGGHDGAFAAARDGQRVPKQLRAAQDVG